jgi:hypothetical protein
VSAPQDCPAEAMAAQLSDVWPSGAVQVFDAQASGSMLLQAAPPAARGWQACVVGSLKNVQWRPARRSQTTPVEMTWFVPGTDAGAALIVPSTSTLPRQMPSPACPGVNRRHPFRQRVIVPGAPAHSPTTVHGSPGWWVPLGS